MIKFMVVIFRKPGLTVAEFRRHLQEVHGPLAKQFPGLKRYIQNFASDDPKRDSPGWDAIVELYFESREAMEAAWESAQGKVSDADLPLFVDLNRTTWSVVEETIVLE